VPQLRSFTEDGPWELDLDHLAWRQGLVETRRQVRDQVPDLVRHRRWPPGLRMLEAAGLLGWPVAAWATTERRRGGVESRAGISRRLRRAFERLGPTYIKLGQIISSGEGLLPSELVVEFRSLRDRVAAEPFAVVERIVEAELGRPLAELFSWFSTEPVAAASIAQVHLATLRTGEEVAVKVQRPDIARLVERDLAVMAWIAPLLARRVDAIKVMNLPGLIELFAETIVEELDFRLEAENMVDIATMLDAAGQDAIVVPRPHPTLVTPRVLVMERLSGFEFTDVAGMRAAGVDTSAVVRACMVSFMEGAMIFGVFHGDLHGGNLFVRPDGRVALLDYGITGRLAEDRRLAFLKMMMGSMSGDQMLQIVALRDLGALPPDTDLEAFLRDVPQPQPVDAANMDPAEMMDQMRQMTKSLVTHGMRIPKELLLFMKDMMFIDGAMATLAPDVSILSEMLHVTEYFSQTYGDRILGEIGLDPRSFALDTSMFEAMGMGSDLESVTHRDMQKMREDMQRAMQEARRKH
jgi:ubiquinone biosynthesis protein